MIVSPPRVIGSVAVRRALGLTKSSLYRRLAANDPIVCRGYLGKIASRHAWNAHELFAGLYGTSERLEAWLDGVELIADPTCGVEDCEHPATPTGVCVDHFEGLAHAWATAHRSKLMLVRLLAMSQWLIDRHPGIDVPLFDPWADRCAVDDCERPLSPTRLSPLCDVHTRKFWGDHRLDGVKVSQNVLH